MRVMVLLKATEDSEKGILPTAEAFEAMGRYMTYCAMPAFCEPPTALSPRPRPSALRSTAPAARSSTAHSPSLVSWLPVS